MTPTNVEFNTSDGVTLRGWFVKPKDAATSSLPCLVMTHGWSCVKEMGLNAVAALLTSSLPISCLIYDHRSFGESDTLPGQPRQEIIPATRASDMRDAITYAQSRKDVNEDQIGLWGFSHSGGLALYLAAVDRRIKAVIAMAPVVDGWKLVHRFLPPDALNTMLKQFESDRLGRAAGERPKMMPVTSADSMASTSLPSRAVWDFVSRLDKIAPRWRNETTVRSLEELYGNSLAATFADRIFPTPALVIACTQDTVAPSSDTMDCYERMKQPKDLQLVIGDHFDVFGRCLKECVGKQVEFLGKTLCKR